MAKLRHSRLNCKILIRRGKDASSWFANAYGDGGTFDRDFDNIERLPERHLLLATGGSRRTIRD